MNLIGIFSAVCGMVLVVTPSLMLAQSSNGGATGGSTIPVNISINTACDNPDITFGGILTAAVRQGKNSIFYYPPQGSNFFCGSSRCSTGSSVSVDTTKGSLSVTIRENCFKGSQSYECNYAPPVTVPLSSDDNNKTITINCKNTDKGCVSAICTFTK